MALYKKDLQPAPEIDAERDGVALTQSELRSLEEEELRTRALEREEAEDREIDELVSNPVQLRTRSDEAVAAADATRARVKKELDDTREAIATYEQMQLAANDVVRATAA
eukprot:4167637-Prymnesium_polylepis.1